MILTLVLAALTLAPWKGADLPTATQAQAKYRLGVSGVPGSVLKITASGVAKGWIAAFCDMRICSPNRVTETIPASGSFDIQFEMIREDDHARAFNGVTLHASDGSSVSVPPLHSI